MRLKVSIREGSALEAALNQVPLGRKGALLHSLAERGLAPAGQPGQFVDPELVHRMVEAQERIATALEKGEITQHQASCGQATEPVPPDPEELEAGLKALRSKWSD